LLSPRVPIAGGGLDEYGHCTPAGWVMRLVLTSNDGSQRTSRTSTLGLQDGFFGFGAANALRSTQRPSARRTLRQLHSPSA
jgi:hypothetical protein